MAYKLKKIELRTKNNGIECPGKTTSMVFFLFKNSQNFELFACLKLNLPNNLGNGREV